MTVPVTPPVTIKDEIKKLERIEAVTAPGAYVRQPKNAMLDARDVQARHPDKHIRWLSRRNADKMVSRKLEGYEVLSEKDGGRSLGDSMVLAAIPRAKYEARVAAEQAENARRLQRHKPEWEKMADNMARQLRDNHGIDIDPERLTRE